MAAAGEDVAFAQAKIATARFYADHLLAKAPSRATASSKARDSVTALALEAF